MSLQEIEGISGWSLMYPLLDKAPSWILEWAQQCESPIEQQLFCALNLAALTIHGERPEFYPQAEIEPYRVDFLMFGTNGAQIIIECDGAEFHKDKAKDAKRTAYLEAKGYRVVRLTGSEIHHNPLGAAQRLLRDLGYELHLKAPKGLPQSIPTASERALSA